ncbi:hypothetical protein BCR35DRAFT_355414 [Leucosporidium creatinivorum]|uniref:Uncharacterized protein n=1 Tax=Leucosporidium creatinivorum TaxID=106004 RepID=A0A1Y2DGE4_9BASI|nr:hypothetical protein BCR35DRAFT_355412 [Leucosporidium creatinivorum]ORY58361.1 hypothetical protein BCR35DRAFT_355414 [Leucosporidium creatinivorum]
MASKRDVTPFWKIREDAMDAEMTTCDQKVLKNFVKMGGITFGRVTSGYELPRPFYSALTAEEKALVEEK